MLVLIGLTIVQDKRAAVAEQALHSLADMTQTAGGDFLARRFSTEAWPLMQAYLQHPQKTLTRSGPIPWDEHTSRPFPSYAPAAAWCYDHDR